MDSLPYHIQSIFPAILTHRGGISRQLADLLRPCFQNAMGPERLHDLLQELHHLRYSRLQLTYLTSIDYQQQHAPQLSFFGGSGGNQSHPSFSNFDDPLGYAGYVPSATYLRMIYTAIMDQLRLFMDKEMMVLDGVVLKGDHTFKIIKHMAKVGGESTFYALYTVCNEFEEIRLQLLVPTKKVTHLKRSFEQMLKSYHLYGPQEPQILYTDYIAGDKRFLQETIPSLNQPLSATTTTSASASSSSTITNNTTNNNSKYISLPDHISPRYIRTASDANIAIEQILSDIQDGRSITIGFDTEWNYNKVTKYIGKTAVVQIAYNDLLLILPILHYGELPEKLIDLLKSNNVVKVGRNVGNDLAKINRDYQVDADRRHVVELGSFAKEKGAVQDGRTNLSNICAAVLGLPLYKGDDDRLSDWESPLLSPNQIYYAGLDAWVSLNVYNSLIERSKNLRKHDYISNDYIQPTAPTTNSSSIYQDDNQGQEYLDSDLLLYDEDIFEEQLEEEVIEQNENYGITRILKDPFHLMAQLKVPKKHSLGMYIFKTLHIAWIMLLKI